MCSESGIYGSSADNSQQEPPKQMKPRVAGAIYTIAAIVVVLAGMKAASGLLGPIMLALFIAIVLLIPLRFLQRNRCPTILSYIIVIGGTIALFVALTYFIGKSLNENIGKIPAYRDRFTEKYAQVEKKLESWGFSIGGQTEKQTDDKSEIIKVNGKVQPHSQSPSEEKKTDGVVVKDDNSVAVEKVPEKDVGKDTPPTSQKDGKPKSPPNEKNKDTAAQNDDNSNAAGDKEDTHTEESTSLLPLWKPSMPEDVPAGDPEVVEQWVKMVHDKEKPLIALDPQNVSYWIASGFLQLRHLVESSFLVLIFTVFMLIEASQFSAKMERALGKDAAINNKHLHQIAHDVRHYLVLKTIVNCASGGAAMFIYYMFGVPAWFFWGVIAFFMYYIPNIGGTLAAIIPGILVFINYDIPGVLLYAACLVALECTIAYGFEPRFLGHGLGLSTVVILLTLVFWGWILGPIGLFLAAPLTVMIKIILQEFPETKWIAILLDDRRWKSAK
ncbi:MAG: AI-2E family transporter [Planctomycetaceae bacterium]|nr:AI-2E family transporter [Planctomycetaceae bacterium]